MLSNLIRQTYQSQTEIQVSYLVGCDIHNIYPCQAKLLSSEQIYILFCKIFYNSYLQYLLEADNQFTKMNSTRQSSEYRLKPNIYDSFRKQRELTNRINVLLSEKQKKLKIIQRRISLAHQENEKRIQKILKRQQNEKSFKKEKGQFIKNSRMLRQFRDELNTSIHVKQSALRETRRQWYSSMKQMHLGNQQKIISFKQKEKQLKKENRRRIKIMEMNSKENIRKYWHERIDYIHQQRCLEQTKKKRMLEESINNISILESKEKQLLEELNNTSQYEKRMLKQNTNINFIEENGLQTCTKPRE